MVAAFVIPRQGLKLKNEKELEIGKKKDVVDLLTTQEVRDWVLKNLSHHLVPKYVFWVDEYPKTASGKIQKFKLREIGMGMVNEGKGL